LSGEGLGQADAVADVGELLLERRDPPGELFDGVGGAEAGLAPGLLPE
jgi:hypothetical protein